MMTNLSCKVIKALKGRTLVTAESCTGGGIGHALTGVPGSSAVYKGGIISYTNQVKINQLNVSEDILKRVGAVSADVAAQMAQGARILLDADIAVSVTGLAGPDGDTYGNPVGTVFIGYCDEFVLEVKEHHFEGNRELIRRQAIDSALQVILDHAEKRSIQ